MTIDEQFIEVIDQAIIAGPASSSAINHAESTLGVIFPKAYREFLEKYGAAVGIGFEIAGLFVSNDDTPPMWRDIVLATQQLRRVSRDILPRTLLPISSDGSGLTFYINADNRTDVDQCAVFAYGPGVDGKRVAEGFKQFVIAFACGDISDD